MPQGLNACERVLTGEPSKLYEAQERAVLQEYHFVLKKILDRVQKKTAQDVDATAAAKATASAALAAVPGQHLYLSCMSPRLWEAVLLLVGRTES